MKKVKTALVIVAMVFSLLPLHAPKASALVDGELTYQLSDGKAAITHCSPSVSGVLILPSTIEGYPITSIDEGAFQGCSSLTAIVLPQGITTIGSFAFQSCSALTSITIPNSLTFIGSYAFWGCPRLERVEISDLTAWCKIIFENILSNPLSLSKKLYLNHQLVTDLVLPKNVTYINNYAFYNCVDLTAVTLPNGARFIGEETFANCSNLKTVVLPGTMRSIRRMAFSKCDLLSDIWYCGTKAEKAQITFISTYPALENATWHCMFDDLPANHWSYESIFFCYKNGIMNGIEDGTKFNPSGTMTRAALVATLYRIEGSPPVSSQSEFTDVADGAWYADAVAWASQNHIVSGTGEGIFAPADAITRASFVAILSRYWAYCGHESSAQADLSAFADAESIPDWARESIEWAVAVELLHGTTESSGTILLHPLGQATRAQGAVLLQKFSQL